MNARLMLAAALAVGSGALLVVASCSSDPGASCTGDACNAPETGAADVSSVEVDGGGDGATDDGSAASAQLAVAISPTAVTLLPDASATIGVTVTRAPGVVGPVDITVTGIGTTFKAEPLQIPASDTTGSLKLDALPIAPSGKRSMSVVASLGALAATAPLDVVVSGLPGQLDGTFGLGGRLKIYVDASDSLRDMILQPDGKILLGVVTNGTSGAVVRLNDDGSLDTTFGTGGIARTQQTVVGLRLAAGGKIVIVGALPAVSGHAPLAVSRLLPNGAVDTTFGVVDSGVPGTVLGNIDPKIERPGAVDIQADGKIVVVGQVASLLPPSYQYCIAMRFEATGAVDTTFGASGLYKGDATCANFSKVLATDSGLLATVRHIVNGLAQGSVTKLTSLGALDTTFGTSGFTDFGNGASIGLAVQATGEIYAGYVPTPVSNVIFARLLSTGAPDSTFGTNGLFTTTQPGAFNDLALYPGGRLVVAGSTGGTTSDFVAMRLLATNGAYDTTWNATGYQITDFGGATDAARAIAVTSTGAILVGGTSGGHVALAKYLP